MSESRQLILDKIRASVGGDRSATDRHQIRKAAYASLPRLYRQQSSLGDDQLTNLFEERLAHTGTKLVRTGEASVAEAVAVILKKRGKHRLVVPPEFPVAWLPQELGFVRDLALNNQALDECEGVVTGCAAAIALSGTVVLQTDGVQGRRALTLLPDYYLCIVRRPQLFETLPEAMKTLNPRKTAPTTFVSGPSATVDIEMVRVRGVHGPRTLDIVLVSSQEPMSSGERP